MWRSSSNSVIPFAYHDQDVRVHLADDGAPRWVARDVCAVLGLVGGSGQLHKYLAKLGEDEKKKILLGDLLHQRPMNPANLHFAPR